MQRINTSLKDTSFADSEHHLLEVLNKQCQNRITRFLESNIVLMFDRLAHLLSSAVAFAPDSEQLLYSTYQNQLRQVKEPIIKEFIDLYKNRYNEALTLDSSDGNSLEPASSLFEKFMNMDEHEIESSIITTHLIAKYQNQYCEEIDELLHLFDDVFNGVATNPIDPVFICSSFRRSIAKIDATMIHDLRLYHHFEEFVLKEMHQLYNEINSVISDYVY